MSFDTPHYGVGQLLEMSANGKLQLPDFQRSYKWEDERIRSLLVTILRGHPMGVLMVLEAGGGSVRFKPRPIEGVDVVGPNPDLLLLDGQQRTTSMFQALTGDGVVDTLDDRGKRIRRRYFLDVQLALGDAKEQDAAVLSVPESGRVTEDFGRNTILDLSTRQLQLEQGCMPFTEVFGTGGAMTWLIDYLTAVPAEAIARQQQLRALNEQVFIPLSQYKIPAIKLPKDTSKEAVATVFEKVNTGGLALNVFELLTATFAGDATYFAQFGTDFRLGDDWQATQGILSQHPVMERLGSTDFLQAVCLLASLKRHNADVASGKPKPTATTARREDVLQLDLQEYLEWADSLRAAVPWVAQFLRAQHIHTAGNLPYTSQLVGLLTFRVLLGRQIAVHSVDAKIRQWYWCGVLGELYGSSSETRLARDVEQVPAWAKNDASLTAVPIPETLVRAGFFEDRLLSLHTRQSAAYKGIYALLMGQEAPCIDWKYNQPIDHASYSGLQVDIHHVFPKAWCVKQGIDPVLRECIVNKTPLAKDTNIMLGGASPASYMAKLDRLGSEPEVIDAIIRSHCIDPATLRAGDFDAFFAARKEALVQVVEVAMGKPVARTVDHAAPEESPDFFPPVDDASDVEPVEDDFETQREGAPGANGNG